MLLQKGFINKIYNKSFLENDNNLEEIEKFKKEILSIVPDLKKENYCEISHSFSPAFKIMFNDFKKGSFISDDSFEALLTYHFSIIEKINLDVINILYSPSSLLDLNLNESFDLLFSSFGLSYENIYLLLPELIDFLKVDGIMALELPSYWFFRENLTETEKNILDYSKQNDKKWLFTEPIEPLIRENGAELLVLKKLPSFKMLNRLELSYISSLNKLHKAQIENNIAVLEVANIQESDIQISKTILVLQKKKKTLTKNNLFNL